MANDNRNRNTARHPNAPAVADDTALVPTEPQAGLVVRGATEDDLRAAFAGMEVAPIFVTLSEGDLAKGTFVRRGSVRSGGGVPDRITGEIAEKLMPTIVLRTERGTSIEMLLSHETERALANLTDADRGKVEIAILRGPEERVGSGQASRMITRYRVATRRI